MVISSEEQQEEMLVEINEQEGEEKGYKQGFYIPPLPDSPNPNVDQTDNENEKMNDATNKGEENEERTTSKEKD